MSQKCHCDGLSARWPSGLRDTGRVPVWLQVVLPLVTAMMGGGVGFGFGRLGKALDRRMERLAAEAVAEAAAEAERARELEEKLPRFIVVESGKEFVLQNFSRNPATDILVAFNDYPRKKAKGLPAEPFALGPMDWVRFRLPISKKFPEPPSHVWVKCAEIAESIPIRLRLVEPLPRGQWIRPE
jgi:hypothetical protein